MKMKIVFGTMTFGVGEGGRISDQSLISRILQHFAKSGGDELDTARMYCDGNTEQVLGDLNVQKEFKLATKAFPFKPGMHSKEKLKEQFEESLKALQSNHVDIFYLHAPDHATTFEETLQACDELYRKGHFTELGLSNYSSWQVMEIYKICKANGYVFPTVYQGRYSVLTRDVEVELLPCLRKLGIRFYAYNPLCGGILAGTLTESSLPEGRFDNSTFQGKKYRERYWKKSYFQAIEKYKQACQSRNLGLVEVAFKYLVHHSKLDASLGDAIIIGASSLEHVIKNLEYCQADNKLDEGLLQILEECWKDVMPVCPTYYR